MAALSFVSGTSDATVTVPEGKRVKRLACVAGGSGATITITPRAQSALPTITLPAGVAFQDDLPSVPGDSDTAEIVAGSTIAFAGISTYYVRWM